MPLRRSAATKVMVFQCPAAPDRSGVRHTGNGRSAEPSWYWRRSRRRTQGAQDQTCPVLASNAGAPAPHPPALAPLRAGFFLKVILRRPKKRHTAVRLPGILCLRIVKTTSSSVRSDCFSIRSSRKSACFSKGEMLPPRGLAAQRPVSRKHLTQIMAVLAVTSNSSAASRREAPPSTAPHACPQNRPSALPASQKRINADRLSYPSPQENPPIQLRRNML
jgi:hypothetical protein